ncbi:MAG: ATPase [Thermoleophilia bacterium]|nr:ATPase [Thermoleophilia bacterium]
MQDQDLSMTMTVDASPDAVFAAINDVASWWSGKVDGSTDLVGAEFTYRYGDVHHSVQRITELVPGERVAWHVTEANLPATEPADEWAGTNIVFELTQVEAGTELRFTHVGLSPSCDCYDRCTSGWNALIGRNLRARIDSGVAQPDVFASMA